MKWFKAGKQSCSHTVDRISDDENLVELWSSKFKGILSSPDPAHPLQLANTLNSLDVSPKDLESLVISEDVVLAAVRKLKWGKSEGGSMSCDHLTFAPSSFFRVLAPVFTALHVTSRLHTFCVLRCSYPANPKGWKQDFIFYLSQKTIEA